MKKIFLIITVFLFFLPFSVFSQEAEAALPQDSEQADSTVEVPEEEEAEPEETEDEDMAGIEDEENQPEENQEEYAASPAEVPEKTTADIDPSTDYLAKSGTAVNAVAWDHSGEYFATSWNNTTILFEAETNNIAAIYSNTPDNTINPFTDITKLSFAPDDSTLLSVHNNNTAMIHSIGDSGSALITGTGDRIADAVFIGSSFRLVLPLDEQNLYDCTRQTGTGSFNIEEKMEFDRRIEALASNGKDGKLFVTFDDGTVNLVDTRTWQILGDMKCYNANEIYPEFAPDGVHFLNSADESHILVSSVTNPQEQYMIEDPDEFIFSAIFTPDGKSIVAATRSGYVRIYDIATGSVTYEFALLDLDTAKTLAASPDGEFVLIGTEMGYIYRWSLHGFEFDAEEKRYYDENGEEYSPAGILTKPCNSLNIMFDYSTLEKYYYGTFGLNVNYRNYALYPLYWGTGLSAGVAPPNDDFPYTYYYEGEEINNPWMYSGMWMLNGGISYYAPKLKITLFSEIGAGIGFHLLHNSDFDASYHGKLYPSAAAEVILGVQYDWLRVSGGVVYDSNLGLLVKGSVGYSIQFTHKKKSKKQGTENITQENSGQQTSDSTTEDL